MTSSSDTLTLHRYKRRNQAYREHLPGGVELIMMRIPAGEFMMGAPEDEPDSHSSQQPQHRVRVAEFLMGQTPVTQAQWRSVVMNSEPINCKLEPDPSKFKGDQRPVEQVSWEEAQEFCWRLSVLSKKDYQLPSEAQWEYACRAGTETAYHFGPNLTNELANFRKSISHDESVNYDGSSNYNIDIPSSYSDSGTTDVGVYPANRWGLYDMHGNVWEWCKDDWHDDYSYAPEDGSAWISENHSTKLMRGGSWVNIPRGCRSSYRNYNSYDFRDNGVGFRLCCTVPKTSSFLSKNP